MGAGGSIESETGFTFDPSHGSNTMFGFEGSSGGGGGSGNPRYFCHSCNRIFQVSSPYGESNNEQTPITSCLLCDSSFIEEYTPHIQSSHVRRHQLQHQTGTGSSSSNGNGNSTTTTTLTQEQARRITNATAMLRLLELQLREELDQLQQAFEQANLRQTMAQQQQSQQTQEQQKLKQLTAAMKVKLRQHEMTVDTICSQPSCPICSEDFCVGVKECKLPCSHIFHAVCVTPWLELKRTCPICRAELTDTVPEVIEFLSFEMNEIDEKLREIGIEVPDFHQRTKHDMANLLHRKINDQKEKEMEQMQQQMMAAASSSSNRMLLMNGGGGGGNDMDFLRVLHMPFLSLSLAGMGGGIGSDMPQISATIRTYPQDDDDSDDEITEEDRRRRRDPRAILAALTGGSSNSGTQPTRNTPFNARDAGETPPPEDELENADDHILSRSRSHSS